MPGCGWFRSRARRCSSSTRCANCWKGWRRVSPPATCPADEVAGLYALLEADLNTGLRGDAYPLVFGDADFHFRIAEGSKSARLQQLLCGDLYSLIRLCRFKTAHVPGQMKSYRDHQRIVEAIQDGDEELAEVLMRRHIAAARKRFIATPFAEIGRCRRCRSPRQGSSEMALLSTKSPRMVGSIWSRRRPIKDKSC